MPPSCDNNNHPHQIPSSASSSDDSLQDSGTTETPHGIRPSASITQPGTLYPPTPTNYEIMTESCDWCLADTPWDDADLFGTGFPAQESAKQPSSTIKSKQGQLQVNLRPRQALGTPMM